MDNGVLIRAATEADVDAVIDLWKELADFHKERDSYFTRPADGHVHFAEEIRQSIANRKGCLLVAEVAGDVAGYCQAKIQANPPVFPIAQSGKIGYMAVTDKYRRMGIGERLCEEVLQWFKHMGISRIEAGVAICNDVSQQFWRKMGFEPYIETVYKQI